VEPGLPWQRVLEEQIQSIPAAIVVVGSAVGPWQDHELTAFLRQFVERGCPVIPVLLPGVERPELPTLLDGMTWVDLAVAILTRSTSSSGASLASTRDARSATAATSVTS
jgi:hypothetical protein